MDLSKEEDGSLCSFDGTVFTSFGIPDKVVSVNGQLLSAESQEHFKHCTPRTQHPQGNDHAERAYNGCPPYGSKRLWALEMALMLKGGWVEGEETGLAGEGSGTEEPSDVSVRTKNGKRKAGADGEIPPKRKRVSESVSGSTGARKRKASSDEEGTRKRQKSSEPEPQEDPVRVKGTERKLPKNEDRPSKRKRVPELDQGDEGSGDAASSSVEATPKKKRDSATTSTSEETSRQEFEAKYQQLNPLGEGGHGSVYAGYRRADHFPVAIKHIPRDNVICKGVTQNKRTLPLEVAVMIKIASGAARSVGESAAISLLDYYDLDQELILILERPVPSSDLLKYIEVKGGSLPEEGARLILKQLVKAARELQSKNIFHRDIKVENILIETSSDVPRLRLIDFGLSCFTKKTSSYRIFYGTSAHIPPEWYQSWTYRAGPTTVWQLGVVLYEMLHRNTQFETTRFLKKDLNISEELSQNCQDVLRLCLAVDPQQRLSLEQLELHPWTKNGKRKAGADGEIPPKRKRVSESVSGSTVARKRKASSDEEGTRKRQKSSEPEPQEDPVRVKGTERKLPKNEDRPSKRKRVPELDQGDEGSGDSASSSVEATPKKKRDSATTSTSEETSRQEFEAKYQQLNPLGEGGHGSVYAGYRRADHFPVAIKHIPRDNVICKGVTQNKRTLPLEVAVMIKIASGAARSVGESAAISLLDYYDLDQELILILERPVPSSDLLKYIEVNGGSLPEEGARLILKQLVKAARELQSKNIFHRDIKVENILIETSSDVPRLRLIDFGLSCFTKKTSSYRIFYGTSAHIPPEWYQSWTYKAGPTTVWQLGVVLYEMLHRNTQFETTRFLKKDLNISEELSQNCQDVLRLCLAVDPQQRPSLEQLELHPWLT
ncbi:ribosomal protein S6 kinase alpha-5-like [Enoplosus armatus]|uniref:ribosomal protein S6 kinase alpha-5-like n=1 Tax=Enoplosus armatus TaxID=215367 RepID=UPI003993C6D1